MTVEHFQLLALRGAVSELPKEDQERIITIKQSIQKLIDDGGEAAQIALSLVALELAVKATA